MTWVLLQGFKQMEITGCKIATVGRVICNPQHWCHNQSQVLLVTRGLALSCKMMMSWCNTSTLLQQMSQCNLSHLAQQCPAVTVLPWSTSSTPLCSQMAVAMILLNFCAVGDGCFHIMDAFCFWVSSIHSYNALQKLPSLIGIIIKCMRILYNNLNNVC